MFMSSIHSSFSVKICYFDSLFLIYLLLEWGLNRLDNSIIEHLDSLYESNFIQDRELHTDDKETRKVPASLASPSSVFGDDYGAIQSKSTALSSEFNYWNHTQDGTGFQSQNISPTPLSLRPWQWNGGGKLFMKNE